MPNVLLGPISLGSFVSLAVTMDSTETPFAKTLGFHSLSLEHETSTGALANSSREFVNLKRELANFMRKLAESKRKLATFEPIIPGFDQLYPGNRRNSFIMLRLTAEHIKKKTSLGTPTSQSNASERLVWSSNPYARQVTSASVFWPGAADTTQLVRG